VTPSQKDKFTAGVLGFDTLLEHARALDDPDAEDKEAFRALAHCRVLPQLIASASRKTRLRRGNTPCVTGNILDSA
jgi:hypothetical protein